MQIQVIQAQFSVILAQVQIIHAQVQVIFTCYIYQISQKSTKETFCGTIVKELKVDFFAYKVLKFF